MPEVTTRVVAYLAILAVLGASVALGALELGPLRIALHFGLAVVQAGFVFAIFMQLRDAHGLVRVMATGSVLWLIFLFGFTMLDYAHR